MTRDEGVALFVVIAAMAMLFVLATMLIMMSVYQIESTKRMESRSMAIQMADAGINAYMYELKRDPVYHLSHPTLGPVATAEGSWSVSATVDTSGSIVLRSTAVVPGRNETRTIIAKVKYPTFADYAMLSDANINWGPNRYIDGPVHSNGSVTQNENTTIITGLVSGVTGVNGYTDAAHMQDGFIDDMTNPKATTIDFNQLTSKFDSLQTRANNSGNYIAPSGAKGYRIVFSGSRYNLDKVLTYSDDTGAITVSAVRTNSVVPTDGVIYINDDTWISGTYSVPITLAVGDPSGTADYDAYIADNFRAADRNGGYKAGVIAKSDIIIPYWYTSSSYPTSWTIQAALLSQNGYVGAFTNTAPYTGRTKPNINTDGSIASRLPGYFLSTDGYGNQTGFPARGIYYDAGLKTNPPPQYPVIGSLKILSWTEQ